MASLFNLPDTRSAARFRPWELSLPGNPTDHAGVNRSLEFMARNFVQPIQIRDLVKISGMSRRGFINAFVKNIGNNPASLLRHMRLERAKQLLVTQDLNLKQIAKMSGFKSENTFCVAFQRCTGTSPKRFQRQYWLATVRGFKP